MVVFWKWIEQEDEETGEKKEVPFLRYSFRIHIRTLQAAHHKAATQGPEEAEET